MLTVIENIKILTDGYNPNLALKIYYNLKDNMKNIDYNKWYSEEDLKKFL